MGSIVDYVRWRGDLRFAQSPFNEIDSLIFNQFSYLDFGGIIPDGLPQQGRTLEAAAEIYFASIEKRRRRVALVASQIPALFWLAAHSRRFAEVKIWGYRVHSSREQETQFSAVCFSLEEGKTFVSFRGTDDSLVGWKEDFNMAFLDQIPAQEQAVAYLEEMAGRCSQPLWVGGHSKGGNLAVYAAALCRDEVKERILAIYNHDGPGFAPAFFTQEGYRKIAPKIWTVLPEESLVGLLFYRGTPYQVAKSEAAGPLQHNVFCWEVEQTEIVKVPEVSKNSQRMEEVLTAWLDALTAEEKRQFVEVLFSLLEAKGSTNLVEVADHPLSHLLDGVQAYRQCDEKTKEVVTKVVASLVEQQKKTFVSSLKEKAQAVYEESGLLKKVKKTGKNLRIFIDKGKRQ